MDTEHSFTPEGQRVIDRAVGAAMAVPGFRRALESADGPPVPSNAGTNQDVRTCNAFRNDASSTRKSNGLGPISLSARIERLSPAR